MSRSPSAPAETNPDSPTPSPMPAPVVPASSLFLPPKGPAAPLPPPSPSSSTPDSPSPSLLAGDAAAPPSWDDSAAGPATTDPRPESSDTPSGGSALPGLSKTGLRAVIGQGFKTLAGALAAVATTEAERVYGVWAPDPEDVEGIAHPASRLIWRRLPDDAKGSDAVDLIGLGLAVAAYVGKNMKRKADVRGLVERGEIQLPAPAADPA